MAIKKNSTTALVAFVVGLLAGSASAGPYTDGKLWNLLISRDRLTPHQPMPHQLKPKKSALPPLLVGLQFFPFIPND